MYNIKTFKQFINEFEIDGDVHNGYIYFEYVGILDNTNNTNSTSVSELQNKINNNIDKFYLHSTIQNYLTDPKFDIKAKSNNNGNELIITYKIGIKKDEVERMREEGILKNYIERRIANLFLLFNSMSLKISLKDFSVPEI